MTGSGYQKSFVPRWADLDPNRHLRHTAYADYATHVRFSYLAENGFPAWRFGQLGIGPVIFREEARYLKEIGIRDSFTIDFSLVELRADGAQFVVRHDVWRGDGVRAAVLSLEGGWLDLETRSLIDPPRELVDLLGRLPRAAG